MCFQMKRLLKFIWTNIKMFQLVSKFLSNSNDEVNFDKFLSLYDTKVLFLINEINIFRQDIKQFIMGMGSRPPNPNIHCMQFDCVCLTHTPK